MSGAGERLDQLIARVLAQSSFDCAVVAWDLVPSWNPQGEFCRWTETIDLYRFLSTSGDLPDLWREKARQRFEELSERDAPSARRRIPPLEPGMVLPVCMEPLFEGLLAQDEGAIKRALGVRGKEPKGWPKAGWSDPRERRPDLNVLAPAIAALRRLRPAPEIFRKIRGDMRTHKNEWGEFLLREILADEQARGLVLTHPISLRLTELLVRRSRGAIP